MGDATRLLGIAEKLQALPFENLNSFQKIFMSIWHMEDEVNNGGFSQYFFNSSGQYAHEVIDNLKLIGAKNCANILKQAIEAINIPVYHWSVWEIRQDYIARADEGVENELHRLDSLFFLYPDDLSDLIARFVSKHAAEFDI